MTDAPKGLPVSVQVRLVQRAKATGIDPNVVLARYAAERFLYRLSRSRYADRFVLKGALLMLVWLGETIRPTRDADLLGFGEVSQESLARIFTDICNLDVEPDGLGGVARTIVDCFKYRNKLGLGVAIEALRFARARKRISNREVLHFAGLLRQDRVMAPYLESVT